MEWHNIPDTLVEAVADSFLGTAEESQTQELNKWLAENDANRTFYENLKRFDVLAGKLARRSSYDTESALVLVRGRLQSKRRRRSLYRKTAATAAACIAIGIFSVFFFPSSPDIALDAGETIIGKSQPLEAISFISGSRSVSIAQDAEIVIARSGDITISGSESEDIPRIDMAQEAHELRLTVPRGRRSSIVLPDGTKVKLNAGTTLTFPSKFAANERRIRVEGEIFVDAAHDPSRPFFVEAGDMTIKVLGTQFNVACYAGDAASSVVLVEGSVEVNAFGERRTIRPRQMCYVDGGKLTMQDVDIEEYTSWKDGYILLPYKMPVQDVLAKIERHYNINFSRSNREAWADRTCWGKLMLVEDVDNIMEAVCLISGTTYERDGDTIYIKPK